MALLGRSSASNTSPWFSASNPEFALKNSAVSDAAFPTTVGMRGNMDCQTLSFTKRLGDPLPLSPLHKETAVSSCFASSLIGLSDNNGLVNVSGTPYVAETTDQTGNLKPYQILPNSQWFVSNTSFAPVGLYAWFNRLSGAITPKSDQYGKMAYRFSTTGQVQIKDKAGNPLPLMLDGLAVSDNGRWAVVDSPGRGLLRIDLVTLEALPFAGSLEFSNGIGAAARFAITGDGRYAAVSSKNYNYFKLYDLFTCPAVPDVISAPLACQSRDLKTFVAGQISGFSSVLYMRFLTNDLISFYASYSGGIGQYILGAPGTSLTGMDYLALGDSFSSGEGSFGYELGTDVKKVNMCHLSTKSYPYVIARSLTVNSFHSVACSGALSYNLVGGGSGIKYDKPEPTSDNQYLTKDKPLDTNLFDWLPGYEKQINFVTANQPKLITMTIIGNDLGFSDIVTKCLLPGTCFPSKEDKQEVFNLVDSKLDRLTDTYKQIKQAAPSSAMILVAGYPQVANPDGSCGLNVHLNHDELIFAQDFISRIDEMAKTAAKKAGLKYVDLEHALDKHRLCDDTDKPAMNGLTAGGDIKGIIGNETYHPTAYGQWLMAQAFLNGHANINQFSQDVMPSSEPSASLTNISQNLASLSSSSPENRNLNKLSFISGSVQTGSDGQPHFVAQITGLNYGLMPNASFTVKLDQTPMSSVTSDSLGNLNLDVSLPNDQQVHEFNSYGQNLAGQTINLSALAASPSSQTCAFVTAAGIDADQDDIDDACDGLIGPSPITVSTGQNNPPSSPATTAAGPSQPSSTSPSGQGSPLINGTNIQFESVLSPEQKLPANTQNIQPAQAVSNQPKDLSTTLLSPLNNLAEKHPVRLLVALVSLLISCLFFLGWNLGSHTPIFSFNNALNPDQTSIF